MCGIVGFITSETKVGAHRRSAYLAQALVADTLRGEDSTGTFFVPHDGKPGDSIGWCRDTVAGYEFVSRNKHFAEYLGTGEEYYAVIGHNRAATVGGVSIGTAHPFQEGPITLVHNGTLTSTSTLLKSQEALKALSDSHAICHNLALESVEDVVSKLWGSFALVWHDSRDNSLNIVRNSKRPLHLAKLRSQDTLLVGSEAEMIYWLARRQKMEIEQLATPAEGQWLKFEAGSIVPTIKTLELYEEYYYPPARVYSVGKYGTAYGGRSAWEPANPVSRAARELPDLTNNTVHVGGRRRDIPTVAQERLLCEDMLVEDRFCFVPSKPVYPHGEDKPAMVSGYLEGGEEAGRTAIVYNVPSAIMKNGGFDRRWVVRPIVPKVLDAHETAVICKLVSTDAQVGRGAEILEAARRRRREATPPTDPVQPVSGDMWTGDNLTRSEFLAAVEGGCIQCQQTITLEDADDTMFVNNGSDPMCPTCVKDWYAMMEDSDAN